MERFTEEEIAHIIRLWKNIDKTLTGINETYTRMSEDMSKASSNFRLIGEMTEGIPDEK